VDVTIAGAVQVVLLRQIPVLEAGEQVVDVPAKLASRRDARVRLFDTGHNCKTDARDAHSIAIVTVARPPCECCAKG
jgi:hypothetical protein